MYENQETIAIHTCTDQFEEMEIVAALEEEGIRYAVQSFEDQAYDGAFTMAMGIHGFSFWRKM
ncbi:MAG TPA: hypothetical protein PLQ35_10815 [bacterium]|nr:hypothetical protein [bacterium]HQL62774.1 hypothetical protein [bacterium]